MNSRKRVIETLKHEKVDRLPRHLWTLPGVQMFRKSEVNELEKKYPGDFDRPIASYGISRYTKGNPCQVGEYKDEWGCVWHVGEPGVIGEVKEFILADWTNLKSYKIPWELLEEADFSEVNRSCAQSDKFVLASTHTRPFERMQFLRGTENLFIDLAYGEKEVYQLRDMLHEFYIKEMMAWADTDVDGVFFMDDWGTQQTLLISPSLWREFYKPLYKDYCNILHNKGKYVFFHSDGNIETIYSDLIEIGVDAINSQLFCMDIEKLGERYAGKVTFWGEIDRQYILPFGTVQDVRNAVKLVAKTLLRGTRTGVIAQCEWGIKDPKENIETVFEEWGKQ